MTRTESFKTERLAAVLSLALKRSSIAVLQRPTIRDGAFGFLPFTHKPDTLGEWRHFRPELRTGATQRR
jgi:hypothetical protein